MNGMECSIEFKFHKNLRLISLRPGPRPGLRLLFNINYAQRVRSNFIIFIKLRNEYSSWTVDLKIDLTFWKTQFLYYS